VNAVKGELIFGSNSFDASWMCDRVGNSDKERSGDKSASIVVQQRQGKKNTLLPSNGLQPFILKTWKIYIFNSRT
jgi:hypothetical protein